MWYTCTYIRKRIACLITHIAHTQQCIIYTEHNGNISYMGFIAVAIGLLYVWAVQTFYCKEIWQFYLYAKLCIVAINILQKCFEVLIREDLLCQCICPWTPCHWCVWHVTRWCVSAYYNIIIVVYELCVVGSIICDLGMIMCVACRLVFHFNMIVL